MSEGHSVDIAVVFRSDEQPWRFPDDCVAALASMGRTTLYDPREVDVAGIVAHEPRVRFIIGDPATGLSRRDLDRAGALVAFIRSGAEVLGVDFDAATESGVLVLNTPGHFDRAVAEFTIAQLVNLARGVVRNHLAIMGGRRPSSTEAIGDTLHGRTLGLVGCGRIGTAVAAIARSLGMRVLAHDRLAQLPPTTEPADLRELLSRSDFVSIHAALTAETVGLLGREQLSWMKPTAYLINTARGPIVDEVALLAALRSGGIAGAALDVFTNEGDLVVSPLIHQPNVIATGHIAGFTAEAFAEQARAAVDAVGAIVRGDLSDLNILNREVLSRPSLRLPDAR